MDFGWVMQTVSQYDHAVTAAAVQWRSGVATNLFAWITLLGKEEVVAVFLAAATVALLLYRRYGTVVAFYLALLGVVVSMHAMKCYFQRPRPEGGLYLEQSYSFPSGHATIAILFYGFLGFLLLEQMHRGWQRKSALLLVMLLIWAVGLSRIYLGVHYVSDVCGGYLLGALWLAVGVSVAKWLGFMDEDIMVTDRKRVVIRVVFIGALLFYFAFSLLSVS